MLTDLILKALSYYGLREIPGEQHNPEILEWFAETGHSWVQTDETAWCSAFINYVAKVTGYEYSGKLDARSWMNVGCPTDAPVMGDVVVLWREKPESWKGHVGLFIREDKFNLWILGGNQNNMVNIQPYPKGRLLGYRTLKKTEI